MIPSAPVVTIRDEHRDEIGDMELAVDHSFSRLARIVNRENIHLLQGAF